MGKQVIIDINIPADQYVALYTGEVKNVITRCREGRVVQFPGNILQQFLSHDGVEGSFVIQFDESNKFSSIEKIR